MRHSLYLQLCHSKPTDNRSCHSRGKRNTGGNESSDFRQDVAETQGTAELGCDEQHGDGLAGEVWFSAMQQ